MLKFKNRRGEPIRLTNMNKTLHDRKAPAVSGGVIAVSGGVTDFGQMLQILGAH